MEKNTKQCFEICVDFDGTCVTHEFPKVGRDIGAAPVLKRLVDEGHKLILYTMRSNRPTAGDTGHPDIEDVTGMFLDDAVNWFKKNGIELYAIQQNPSQKQWTTSPKCYGHYYIDDAAIGCPLISLPNTRPYVDWRWMEGMLEEMGILESK